MHECVCARAFKDGVYAHEVERSYENCCINQVARIIVHTFAENCLIVVLWYIPICVCVINDESVVDIKFTKLWLFCQTIFAKSLIILYTI